MAYSRNSWFRNWFASSNSSDVESQSPLLIDEESEDDEIIIDLSHAENIADSHFSALKAAISSDGPDDLEYIEVAEESGDEADPSYEITNDAPDYFLLKIDLLRRLLDECLVNLQSAERSASFKNKRLPLACYGSIAAAGVLILLTGIVTSAIPATRYNKIAHAFDEAYKTTPIPNNIGVNYSCKSLEIYVGLYGTTFSKLNMGSPRGACGALSDNQENPAVNPLFTQLRGPLQLEEDASSICLATLKELCKEFNKTFYSKNKYLALVLGIPVCFTIVALFLIFGGLCSIPRNGNITLFDLAVSPEERKRIHAILSTFNIDLTNSRQPVEELKTEIETLKENLNSIERHYLTEKIILPQIQGQDRFFSKLLDMACPEDITAKKATFEETWVTAQKKGLFK